MPCLVPHSSQAGESVAGCNWLLSFVIMTHYPLYGILTINNANIRRILAFISGKYPDVVPFLNFFVPYLRSTSTVLAYGIFRRIQRITSYGTVRYHGRQLVDDEDSQRSAVGWHRDRYPQPSRSRAGQGRQAGDSDSSS